MARPNLVRTKTGGEIILKNVDEQLLLAIKALVSGEEPVKKGAVEEVKEEQSDLPYVAIGTFKVGNEWRIAHVKFSEETGEAVVDKVEPCGDHKVYANEKFRLSAGRLGF